MRHDNFSIAEFSYIPELPKRIHDYGLWLFNSHCPTPQLIRNTSPLRNTFEHCPIRRFHYNSISHLLAEKGRVWLENGMQRIVNPGDCIITLDGMLNRYGAIEGEPYVEDNLCFKGPVADMMRKSGLLQSGVFHLGQIRRLKPIHELLLLLTVDSHLAAAMKLQHLLGEIYFSRQPRKTGKTATPLSTAGSCVPSISTPDNRAAALFCSQEACRLRKLPAEKAIYQKRSPLSAAQKSFSVQTPYSILLAAGPWLQINYPNTHPE